jgi:putative transposase
MTLKKEATRPAGDNFLQQQDKFDTFVDRASGPIRGST